MPHAVADEKKPAPLEFKPNKASVLPPGTRTRLEAAGIDLTAYPTWPERPSDVKLAASVRAGAREHQEPGARADKEKKALFAAAKEDLTPQAQRDLGAYFGEVEVHPTAAQVPGLPGVSIIWDELSPEKPNYGFRSPFATQDWHTDLTHEKQPPGITHLHLDESPEVGGDTNWASGYSAYDHLSPSFRKIVDGLKAVYRSAHSYPNPEDPTGQRIPIEREHPLVRTHPATGWKSLFVNRKYTLRIVGFDKPESDLLLGYLFDLYEKSLDSQIRFKWTPRTSALWDNRVSIHAAVYDHEGKVPRHGTRLSSLAEIPYFDPSSPSRRAALGLDKPEDFEYRAKNEAY